MAAQVSPSGPRLAGRFGASLLSIGATNAGGFDVLGAHWTVMEERAAEFGTTVDRRKWRLVGPMHIADTKEQAYEDVRFGLPQWVDYFQRVAALPLGPDTDRRRGDGRRHERLGLRRDRHASTTPSRRSSASSTSPAASAPSSSWPTSGPPREATWHSYELMARYVFPRVPGLGRRARRPAATGRPRTDRSS